MTESLFRPEVLEARRTQWLGRISLAQPLPLWLLTSAATLAAGLVIAFLVLGTYSRRSSVTGQLVPALGLATVLAPATGVVSRLDADEGGRVETGQMLGVVTVPSATLASGDTQAALELRLHERAQGLQSARSAQLAQFDAQEHGLRAQLEVARQELVQTEREVGTRQHQIDIARETLQRLRQLQDSKYVSLLQIKQQEASVLEYTSQMQALQGQAIAGRRGIAQLEQALGELPAQRGNARAGYQREQAALEQERVQTQANGALAVTAPVTGMIATQNAKPGQAIQAGQPLLSLLPGDILDEKRRLILRV